MGAFKLPVDIANRVCQHLGAQRILTTDFSEVSQQATEIGACYDQLRESELRRNLWTFATRRYVGRPVDLGTVIWTPPTYAAGTTYSIGEVVIDSAGDWWQSQVSSNLAHTPTGGSAYWSHYAGSDAPALFSYAVDTQYFAGELVVVPATYAGGTTYSKYDIVKVANTTFYDFYVSLQDTNTGHTPASSATYWQLYTDWTATDPSPTNHLSYPTGYAIYMALATGLGDDATTVPGVGNWRTMNGTVTPLQILYPIGTGPRVDSRTSNVYRLPHGFLRKAPTNPKGSAHPWLGAPHTQFRDDWVMENGYFVSAEVGAIGMRYVMDFVDVQFMDPMFCEGLAARIGMETASRISDSETDFQKCASEYKRVMGEARIVNGIEMGSVDLPEDLLISCRL